MKIYNKVGIFLTTVLMSGLVFGCWKGWWHPEDTHFYLGLAALWIGAEAVFRFLDVISLAINRGNS